MYDIIKNAPPPKAKSSATYPFADMEVGDAFDAPRTGGGRTSNDCQQNRINAAAYSWTKRRGGEIKFTVRIIDESTVRCYRIA